MENEQEGEELVKSIIVSALRNNPRLNIGGSICYNGHDHSIFQFLEGKKEDVLKLHRKIELDERHINSSIELLYEVSVRRYKEFGMLWTKEQESKELLTLLKEDLERSIEEDLIAQRKARRKAAPPMCQCVIC